jgi:nitroimidazol reductase NimA-like FMN-containing flavoprotein (pyridoxamine 5'-phosphate oxidase superfamily)
MADERLNKGWEELTTQESQHLLGTQSYGRIGLVAKGRPEIFPVNYSLDSEHCVIFRTAVGLKLAEALNHRVVFEVDNVDQATHHGWSVVVHGTAHHTERVADGDRPLDPWVPDRPYLVRITSFSITGRFVGPRPAELDTAAV